MTDPDRVARWWPAVATVWVLETGQTAPHVNLPVLRTFVTPDAAVVSVCAVGMAWLAPDRAWAERSAATVVPPAGSAGARKRGSPTITA
jgi:hypothetical protein